MNQTQEVQLPDQQTAFDTIMGRLHNQIILTKVSAALGMPIRTEKQATHILATAMKLEAAEEADLAKQAAAGGDFFASADGALDRALAQSGIDITKVASAADNAVLATVDDLMRDPTVYNSVLVLKSAEADAISAQLEAEGRL